MFDTAYSAGRFRPEALFRPRRVALIGEGARAALIAANADGFPGLVRAADPAMPGAESPDLAIVDLPPGEVAPALRELAARGLRAAIVPGPALGLGAVFRATGMRILGPFSFGLAVPGIGLNATLGHLPVAKGRLALVAQSSALARTVLDWAAARELGFSHIVGLGASATFGFAEVLDWLSRDPGTGAILLDVRRVRDRRAFLSAARAAARLRPVVALRPWSDRDGDSAFAAAMRRAGLLAASTLDEMFAAAETLPRVRPASGPALAIVANGAGPAMLAAGALRRAGGEFAAFDASAEAALRALLPANGSYNPLLLADAPVGRLAEAAAMVSALPGVGGVLAIHAPRTGAEPADIAALAAAAGAAKAPLIACVLGEATAAAHRDWLTRAGVPVFATPEHAVRAFLLLAEDRANRRAAAELPPRDVVRVGADRAAAARILTAARAAGRTALAEDEALAVLGAYGIPTVPTRHARRADEVPDAIAAVGMPAVVKIRSADLAHKTAVGGVALGIRSPEEGREVAEGIAADAARRAPRAHLEGYVVQRQAAGGHELQIDVRDDALFGPVIRFGHGGTAADVIDDRACDLPPLNLVLARGLVGRTRVARLLAGWRDRPAVPLAMVADVLVRVSQLVVDHPEIGGLDINPLFADADGMMAVDAWIGLRPRGTHARLAIAPYPEELARHFIARDGERLLIRPIRPEDAAAHKTAFASLTPEDIRFRFFSAIGDLSAEQIARMTSIDYDREMALIAVREATGETLGVARLVRMDNDEAEYAIIVPGALKRKGVGSVLMRRLLDWARGQGIRSVVGDVLADNHPMLAFVARLGFTVTPLAEDPEVVRTRLVLQ